MAPPKLSPELRALVFCARAVLRRELSDDLWVALEQCPSVDRLCEAAVAHGMLGHLSKLIAEERPAGLSPALIDRVAGLQRAIALRNLRHTAILLRLLEALKSDGIQAMCIKGPVWAQLLYGDIALRNWSDLDLLVRPEDVAASRRSLLALGFGESAGSNEMIMRRGSSGGEMGLHSKDGGVSVDLHWQITTGVSPHYLSTDLIFADAGEIDLLDRKVLCPSRSLVLLVTCLEGAKDGWQKVESLLGLAIQTAGMSADEVRALDVAATGIRCSRRVTTSIKHAHDNLGIVEDTISMGKPVSRVRARLFAGSLANARLLGDRDLGFRQQLSLLIWRVGTEDTLGAGLRHLARTVFEPGPGDWQHMSVPEGVHWLHYFSRPVRLTARLLGVSFTGMRRGRRRRLPKAGL